MTFPASMQGSLEPLLVACVINTLFHNYGLVLTSTGDHFDNCC